MFSRADFLGLPPPRGRREERSDEAERGTRRMVELFPLQLAPSLRTFGTRLSHQGGDFLKGPQRRLPLVVPEQGMGS
jgi:hypothetical protein